MSVKIFVSNDQIDTARALIHIRGGEDKVAPVIVRIAHAEDVPPTSKSVVDRRNS